MHYSIIIQGEAPNGSFTWSRGNYRFKNPYITMMKVLFTPNGAAFTNIDTQNIVTNSKNERVVFDKGYYTLAEILAMLNEMQWCQFSIVTSGYSFGCIKLNAQYALDLSKAPEIREILGLSRDSSTTSSTMAQSAIYDGLHFGTSIIDITRNRQVVQVYSSIVRTSDLKIANQNNNLLTTMMFDDPQSNYLRKIEDVCIPICNRFDKLYFSFKDLDGNLMKLQGQFELQLTVDDVTEKSQSESHLEKLSQFSLTQVCNTPKTVVKLENPLSFKQCYISAISLYTDFQLYNVPKDQVIVIDGNATDHATVEIPKGTYEIEEVIAMLNTSDALFELIYDGTNAFRVSVNYFYRLDFTRAPTIQKILGFEQSVIQKGTEIIKRYYLTSSANQLVVTTDTTHYTLVIPTGYYTFADFIEAVRDELTKVIPVVSTQTTTQYVAFNVTNTNCYFDRASADTTINNYGWTPWFKLNPTLKNLCIERPDESMNGTNGYAFLPDSYVFYDQYLRRTDQFYLIKPSFTYTMTEDSTVLTSGTVSLTDGDYSINTLAATITSNLNTIYQQAKGISDSQPESIQYTNNGNQINGATTAPIVDISISAYNYTNLPLTKNTRRIVLGTLHAKDVEYGTNVRLLHDITYTHATADDPTPKTYTITKGEYNKTELINSIMSNISNHQLFTRTVNGRTVVQCRSNNVPTRYTTCSDPVFPIPNGSWRNFTFKFSQASSAKMPSIATPEEFITAFADGLTIENTVDGANVKTSIYYRIFFADPSKLSSVDTVTDDELKTTPSFIGSTDSHFIYYNNTTTKRSSFPIKRCFRTKSVIGSTMTYTNSSGDTKTISIHGGNITQEGFIQDMNTKFLANNIPLEWVYTASGYTIKTDDPFTLTCPLLNDSFLGPSTPVSGSISHIWTIPFNQLIQLDNTEALYSENPVDITNNLSTLKLYCNIVKSKTKPLLSNIPIEDLYKNYFYKNRLVIPCMEHLDRLEYEFRNEGDEELSFLGNIYVLLTFTIQE